MLDCDKAASHSSSYRGSTRPGEKCVVFLAPFFSPCRTRLCPAAVILLCELSLNSVTGRSGATKVGNKFHVSHGTGSKEER